MKSSEYGTVGEDGGFSCTTAWKIALKYNLPMHTPLEEVWDVEDADPLVEAVKAANVRHKYSKQV